MSIAPGISVRRDGENIAIEDYDVEFGKPVLTRISLVDAATAIRIGRVLVQLGLSIERKQSGEFLRVYPTKTLEFAPSTDPYPEDRE